MVFIEDIKILGGDFNFNINVEVWAITPFTMEIHLYNLVRAVPLYGGGGGLWLLAMIQCHWIILCFLNLLVALCIYDTQDWTLSSKTIEVVKRKIYLFVSERLCYSSLNILYRVLV